MNCAPPIRSCRRLRSCRADRRRTRAGLCARRPPALPHPAWAGHARRGGAQESRADGGLSDASTTTSFAIRLYFFVTWDYIYRGLVKDARAIAIRLIASGESSGDPRAIGFANWILGWINVISGSPEAALVYADECLRLAIAPFDRLQGEVIEPSPRSSPAARVRDWPRSRRSTPNFERLGALYNVLEGPRGVALIETGRISEGIRLIERTIAAREAAGDRSLAAFTRILLAEVYIEILSGGGKASAATVLRNLPALAARPAPGRAPGQRASGEGGVAPQLSDRGAAGARIDFGRGRLFAMRGKPAQARACFERARDIADEQGLDLCGGAARTRSRSSLRKTAGNRVRTGSAWSSRKMPIATRKFNVKLVNTWNAQRNVGFARASADF